MIAPTIQTIANTGDSGTLTVIRQDGPEVVLRPGESVEVLWGRDWRFHRVTWRRRLLMRLGWYRWLP